VPVSSSEGEAVRTYQRICIEDHAIHDQAGNVAEVKRGKEYITSPERDGEVTVFGAFWVKFPSRLFAGERLFTRA
jgi:hypothetical protein